MESNSLLIVNILNGGKELDPWSVKYYVVECKSMMLKFQLCNLVHVRSSANCSAHELA